MKAFLLTVIVALLAADVVAYFEVKEWVHEERERSFGEGMHFGYESAVDQHNWMDCDTETCDALVRYAQLEEQGWVDFMFERYELDQAECFHLGGCEQGPSGLSAWQEEYVRLQEPDMAADGRDARPRVHLEEGQ